MPPAAYTLVLDDHPLVAQGMAHYLQAVFPDIDHVAVTDWAAAQYQRLARGCPVLVVADVWLPSGSGLLAMVRGRPSCPHTPWLVVSGDDDPSLPARARAAGARGFVHKQAAPDTLRQAVAAVLAGGTWFAAPPPSAAAPGLTLRQNEVLALLLRGLPNKRIATQLGISESTVKEHVSGLMGRLGARSRIEVITRLGRHIPASDAP
ncbi:response regulator transcription factor [Hydrogenophaga sp. OTU3427]|uniref:response regulator transcription factor n=1 Tax=Hydrogenophaga sp. OTU3427 TaxID=3043856 RepID=UPI00313D04FC